MHAIWRNKLKGWGFEREVAIMQSNGGVAPLRQLGARSAYIVRSGPAAGVTAAARIAAEAGFQPCHHRRHGRHQL
jgi:N-methylhydantoinase A